MPKKGIDQESRSLFIRNLVKLNNTQEVDNFLKDLFSSSEIIDFSRRIMAAKYLFEGKTYEEINSLMGMSPTTINKIKFKTKGSRILTKLIYNEKDN